MNQKLSGAVARAYHVQVVEEKDREIDRLRAVLADVTTALGDWMDGSNGDVPMRHTPEGAVLAVLAHVDRLTRQRDEARAAMPTLEECKDASWCAGFDRSVRSERDRRAVDSVDRMTFRVAAYHASQAASVPQPDAGSVTHKEAREIALRFIDAAFDNHGVPRPRMSIPADPQRDDDLRLIQYIAEQERRGEPQPDAGGECEVCVGTGKIIGREFACSYCRGTGRAKVQP